MQVKQERDAVGWRPPPDPPRPGDEPTFDEFVDLGNQGLVRRFLTTWRHATALLLGGLAAYLRGLPPRQRRWPRNLFLRSFSAVAGLPVRRDIYRQPFPVQLRRRLEMLGPTYIKLGQILSMREDLLPDEVTTELKKLLDGLPAVPHAEFMELVSIHLGRPLDQIFAHVSSTPLGSASIGQIHRATMLDGSQVVLKVVKPGIRATLKRDTILLRGLGNLLQLFFGRYQPRRVIAEFCDYTLREADLTFEADNAETFAAAFHDQPDIVFPEIYHEYSNEKILCMEFLDGIKPTDPEARAMRLEDRERLVDLGAEAIVCMLYRDGFFHADLHPANLIILPGPRCGFIDLGMVGRFDTDLKHSLLYYYHSLVSGDAESAAGYLCSIAETNSRSDLRGFRNEVEELCRIWTRRTDRGRFSLARLILLSVARGVKHRVYFPVEMVLMVKAIVTFEAVGSLLVPDLDVARVSRKYAGRILLRRFGPLRLAQESLTALPELADALAKTPRLLTEGLRLMERATRSPTENPLTGLRSTIFGGSCLVAGAVLAGFGGPWPIWAGMFVMGTILALRRGR